jgi:hypothetical protein
MAVLVLNVIAKMIRAEETVSPVHAMKAFRGKRRIAPLILDLGTRWR